MTGDGSSDPTRSGRGRVGGPRAAALTALSLAAFAAALASIALSREAGGIATVWLPNAVVVGLMLRGGGRGVRPGWAALLAAAANAAANLASGDGPALAAGLAAANSAEILCAYALARPVWPGDGDGPGLLRPLAAAVAAGPLAGALAGSAVVSAAMGAPYWEAARGWWLADATGMLILLPVVLGWSRARARHLLSPASLALAAVACALAAAGVLQGEAFPWPLLAGLPLLATGLLWASPFATAAHGLLVAAAAVGAALARGPAPLVPGHTAAEEALFLQLLIGLAIVPALVAAAAVARRAEAERRLAEGEARYRALVEAAPDGVLVQRDGVVLLANARLAALLGAEGPGALAGRRVLDLVHEEDRGLLLAGPPTAPAELRLRRQGGDRRGGIVPVEAAWTEVPFGGRPAVQLALRDTAERRWAERALADRNRALEAANQELDRFASIAAHDLRAPLRHIGLLAGWAEEELGEAAPEGARERLRQIAERAGRMGALIDGLRRYAQAGRSDPARGPVDLAALVRGAIELIAPPPGFRFELDLEPAVLVAAEPPLATVLRNLLANAVRHHDRAEGLVRVAARPSADGRLVEFRVDDDGPGIPPRLDVLVFDLFRSFGPDLRPAGEGVGLTLVRRIVTAHGGKVWIRPKGEGARGTDMRFTWPVPTAGGEGDAGAEEAPPLAA